MENIFPKCCVNDLGESIMTSWMTKELSGSIFKEKRLDARFRDIVKTLSRGSGKSIPEVCERWPSTKAMYRFLSNDRVDESEILAGHFIQTGKIIDATKGPILVLHDTCEFSYKRKNPEDIGFTRKGKYLGKHVSSELGSEYTVCGILMHASLAITPEGLPLELTSTKFWTRKVFKNTTQMKRKINPTRVPVSDKECIKWIDGMHQSNKAANTDNAKVVYIGDRENDIYEYFTECDKAGTHFISRSCVNRLANDSTLAEELVSQPQHYKHKIRFTDKHGDEISARLNVKVKT